MNCANPDRLAGVSLLQRLWKPWFVHRPSQLLRRALSALHPPAPGCQPLTTSWGMTLLADPSKTIGRSIATTGIYDLAVSEALARLIEPGDTVIDAGANIGYMTLLAAVVAGPAGKVLSFEPHPDLFAIVQRNVVAAREQCGIGQTELHNVALGAQDGTAELVIPSEFAGNDGIARIATTSGPGEKTIVVALKSLDNLLGGQSVRVMKLDVEGFEIHVLRGATGLLQAGRIRHIVFEDHEVEGSAVVRFLQGFGYRVFALGWSMAGIALADVAKGRLATSYEAPSYLATLDAGAVMDRTRAKGWSVLKRLTSRRT